MLCCHPCYKDPPSWDPFLARQALENALKDAEAAGVGSDVLECLATSVEACEPKGLISDLGLRPTGLGVSSNSSTWVLWFWFRAADTRELDLSRVPSRKTRHQPRTGPGERILQS